MHPFERDPDWFQHRSLRDLNGEPVEEVFRELRSGSLLIPKGDGFTEMEEFEEAFWELHYRTEAFRTLNLESAWEALEANALCFCVLRSILGIAANDLGTLTVEELANRDPGRVEEFLKGRAGLPQEGTAVSGDEESDPGDPLPAWLSRLPTQAARAIDVEARSRSSYFATRTPNGRSYKAYLRSRAMTYVACQYIGDPDFREAGNEQVIHRLDKFDTKDGLKSLHAAIDRMGELYPHYLFSMAFLGRPYGRHRDAVSELVGYECEDAVEHTLREPGIPYVRTQRAQAYDNFPIAPDFFIPDPIDAAAVIEAKICNDDGTARDKVSRIEGLANTRNEREREGEAGYDVIAVVDGRGFQVRRSDMAKLLKATRGRLFTLGTLDNLVEHTRIAEFVE